MKKLLDRCCCFCQESDYSLLDVHRITPGAAGGKYTEYNTITACGNCHRKIHAETIKTYRKYPSTSGRYVLHCEINGVEQWITV